MDCNQFNLLNRISTYREYVSNHEDPNESDILAFLLDVEYISPRFTTSSTFYSITEKGRGALFQHRSKIDVNEQVKSMSQNVSSIDSGLKDEREKRKKGDRIATAISIISVLIALASFVHQLYPSIKQFFTSAFF